MGLELVYMRNIGIMITSRVWQTVVVSVSLMCLLVSLIFLLFFAIFHLFFAVFHPFFGFYCFDNFDAAILEAVALSGLGQAELGLGQAELSALVGLLAKLFQAKRPNLHRLWCRWEWEWEWEGRRGTIRFGQHQGRAEQQLTGTS